jgi:hypothetical protein
MKPHNERFVEFAALTPVGSFAISALPDRMKLHLSLEFCF